MEETPGLSFEIFVIDNQSDDGSLEAIEAEFGDDPRFIIVKSEANLGFAAANNEMARKAKGRFLLLLNPDTVVLDRGIERLVEFAEQNSEHRDLGWKDLVRGWEIEPHELLGRLHDLVPVLPLLGSDSPRSELRNLE